MSFDKAIDFVLQHEGGYVNDPKDAGGETKYGISKRAYPKLDIKSLTLQQAKDLYMTDYWKIAHCYALPEPLDLCIFDYAVNAGPIQAVMTLQTLVGTTPDGIWGPDTVSKIQVALTRFGAKKLAIMFCSRRSDFYIEIVKHNLVQARFLKGWMKRVFDVILEVA